MENLRKNKGEKMITEGKKFGNFMKCAREKKNISLAELCEGLCSLTTAQKLETGERIPELLLRARLMERLGYSCEGFEIYVGYQEYEDWKERQRIVRNMYHGEIEAAGNALKNYEEIVQKREDRPQKGMKKTNYLLRKQFILYMKAQIMMLQKKEAGELTKVLEEAIKLTIPGVLICQEEGSSKIDTSILKKKVLAPLELSILADYISYQKKYEEKEREKNLFAILEQMPVEKECRVLILPKITFFITKKKMEELGNIDIGEQADKYYALSEQYKKILALCNQSIELLRDKGKMYYLWELLHIKREILQILEVMETKKAGSIDLEYLKRSIREIDDWCSAIVYLTKEYGGEAEQRGDMYLFQEGNVNCINDVIACRRKMKHMTESELAEGFCDVRTIKRIEKRETNGQREVVANLFKKLGLSSEYQKQGFVTEQTEVKKLENELKKALNMHEVNAAEKILDRLGEITDNEDIGAKQFQYVCMINNAVNGGKLSQKEGEICLLESLRESMPIENMKYDGEIYLALPEAVCVKTIFAYTAEKSKYCEVLIRYCKNLEKMEKEYSDFSLYEIIKYALTSYYGDKGEYEESNKMSKEEIRKGFFLQRMNMFHMYLYNIWWNQKQIDQCERKEILKKCILLSNLCKEKLYERFYLKKLTDL